VARKVAPPADEVERSVRFRGTTADVTTCEHCGRADLKKTVILEFDDSGEPVHYGVVCAAHALGRDAKYIQQRAKTADDENDRRRAKATDAARHAGMEVWRSWLAEHAPPSDARGKVARDDVFRMIESLGGWPLARAAYRKDGSEARQKAAEAEAFERAIGAPRQVGRARDVGAATAKAGCERAIAALQREPDYGTGDVRLRGFDLVPAHLGRSFPAEEKQSAPVRRVNLADLLAIQDSVDRQTVIDLVRQGSRRPILVTPHPRGLVIQDGHHRAYAAKLRGETTIEAKVLAASSARRVGKAAGRGFTSKQGEKVQQALGGRDRLKIAPVAVTYEGRRYMLAKARTGYLAVESSAPEDDTEDDLPLYKGESVERWGTKGKSRDHARSMAPIDLGQLTRVDDWAPYDVDDVRAFLRTAPEKFVIHGLTIDRAQLAAILAHVPGRTMDVGGRKDFMLYMRGTDKGAPHWIAALGAFRIDDELPAYGGGTARGAVPRWVGPRAGARARRVGAGDELGRAQAYLQSAEAAHERAVAAGEPEDVVRQAHEELVDARGQVDWLARGLLTDERLPEDYDHEILEAAIRAHRVGAKAPLTYVGAGMTGIVFCEQGKNGHAFKVGRDPSSAAVRETIADEAEWLRVAGTVPEIRAHVARLYQYHPEEVVIERECIRSGRSHYTGRSTRSTDTVLWELHRQIEKAMIPHGFTAPEFKSDSYVYARGRGWVVVDAGFVHRVGGRLVAETVRRLAQDDFDEADPYGHRTASTAAFGVRMEGGRTISPERAQRLSDRLEARAARRVGHARPVSARKAKAIGDEIGIDWRKVELGQFRRGLAAELEHSRGRGTDVVHGDLPTTGRIAWAHLKEIPDYYTRLDRMEREAARERRTRRVGYRHATLDSQQVAHDLLVVRGFAKQQGLDRVHAELVRDERGNVALYVAEMPRPMPGTLEVIGGRVPVTPSTSGATLEGYARRIVAEAKHHTRHVGRPRRAR